MSVWTLKTGISTEITGLAFADNVQRKNASATCTILFKTFTQFDFSKIIIYYKINISESVSTQSLDWWSVDNVIKVRND